MSNQQKSLRNEKLRTYKFLQAMQEDSYYPKSIVKKGKELLVNLCVEIEATEPNDLAALYALTHATIEEFNELELEFDEHDSEIDDTAKDAICGDIEFIAKSYGFEKADIEELTAPREW